MGLLKYFDLSKTGCTRYVETGTGRGISLGKAYPVFAKCYSVDMDEAMVAEARAIYPRATIDIGTSAEILEKWLSCGEIPVAESVLFYLDAHFPGADFRGGAYSVSSENAVPLETELKLIKRYRPDSPDLIICDDARIYMVGPFENGNVEWLQVPGGFSFLNGLFPMQNVSVNFGEEGYLIIDRR